jgi:MscS family membrane protein
MEGKMCSNGKRLCNILFSISVICLILNFYWPTWAQNVEANYQKDKTAPSIENKANTESSSDLPAKEIPKEPTKIDQVGEKVGHQIDDLTQKASSRIGAWINSKAFYGITWLKLILSFLLLFVVLLIERIVRLTIDRRKRRIEEEKEVKPIRHLIL